DLRFDLADFFVHQIAPVFFAGDDRFARFFHARGAQRVGLPRESKRRLGFFPGLQQRLIGPLWRDRWIRILLVEVLNRIERHCGRLADDPVHRALQPRAYGIRHKPCPSTLRKNASYLGPTLCTEPYAVTNSVAAETQNKKT